MLGPRHARAHVSRTRAEPRELARTRGGAKVQGRGRAGLRPPPEESGSKNTFITKTLKDIVFKLGSSGAKSSAAGLGKQNAEFQ